MIQLQLTAVIASVSIFLAIVAIFLRNALLVASGLYVRVNPTGSERVFTPSPATDKLASHIYADDGLLHVNPNGQHPIIELMGRAQKEWQTKLDRASKTLPAAVAEYQRRYKRLPPPGFDAWWNYVEEHNVMLPDEYDQIWRDLEPFWAMEPLDLQRLVEDEQAEVETYTIGRDNMTSPVALVNFTFADPEHWKEKNALRGADDIVELLKDVQQHLPPFRAVISPMDNPMLLADARTRGQLFAAAAKNQTVPLSGLPKAETKNLQLTCRPTSPAYKYGIDFTKPPPALPKGKTFIWNHRTSMDPCIHPSLFYQHGEFLGLDDRNIPPQGIRPRFSDCSTFVHYDIQLPTMLGWVDDVEPSDDPDWEDKHDQRMTWRGSNTGIWFDGGLRWKGSQRARLVQIANEVAGTVDVLIPGNGSSFSAVGPGVPIDKAKINPALFDIAFAGNPIDCDPDVCQELEEIFDFRRRQSLKEAGRHKYIFDMDGNAWSSRFKRVIATRSLVFKSTVYPEWFLDRIQPWVHYVPVQIDLSDFHDTFLFFHGGLYGEGGHEEEASKIAAAGRVWGKTYWRKEDMTAYLFRLFLEYARVLNKDRHLLVFSV
ncbi:hypothetical protein BDN71DRAFT_1400563 [Pleurotus eryngii]|uniref:Glycosyl transferase CAP10 domain-containing protein n=1 Tax=Pleurotus eryngii TaxID=5323 RepID=A0A9P5ZLL4_PLEER|nr:hypothetical protein BDN71DRAFT_1400563 [Pleurotus eryngii]